LSEADVAFVRDVVPTQLESFPPPKLPKVIRHPAGFSIAGAPVGTFLRSSLLIAGRKVLGNRYNGSPFYEMVEKNLAFVSDVLDATALTLASRLGTISYSLTQQRKIFHLRTS
jgi:hypothetical protein